MLAHPFQVKRASYQRNTHQPTSVLKTHFILPLLICGFFSLSPIVLADIPNGGRTAETAVTPFDNSRHGAFLREIQSKKGDFDFILIGDSITDFWPGRGKDSYASFLPWKPLDLGVAGDTTEDVLYRIMNGELEGIHPKIVMIMIGTNNLARGMEQPEWTAAGVKKIVEVVRAKCPKAKILLLAIFPRSDKGDKMMERVTATNKLIAPLGDNKTIFFMDIGSHFTDAQGKLKEDLFVDKLHPNPAGYQAWLEAVKPKLVELMGSAAPVAAPAPAH